MYPLFKVGLENEPIDWKLISQSATNGKTTSVFEAFSRKYNRVYHLVDISGGDIAVSQHLSFR